MNEFLAAVAAFVITIGLLGIGKKPKKLFKSNSSEYISPKSTTSLILQSENSFKNNYFLSSPKFAVPLPKTKQEKFLLIKHLKKLISSGPEDRLIAIQTAREWGDSSVIPILRIGLKDFDNRIVISAAEGICKFRSFTKGVKNKQNKPHPLNVSLMR